MNARPRQMLALARGLRWESPDGDFRLEVPCFSLRAGERIALCGPSGAGKSTLLGLLALALRPAAAKCLELAGTDALALWRKNDVKALTALRARNCGFVPQTGALLPFLSIRDNIQLALDTSATPLSPKTRNLRLMALAEKLEIADILKRLPAALSVGQRQRAAIARALIAEQPLILADEPTASVHPEQGQKILSLLHNVSPAGAVLMVTHNREQAENAGFTCIQAHGHRDASPERQKAGRAGIFITHIARGEPSETEET